MAQTSQFKLQCPKCGKKFETTTYDAIYRELDKEAYKRLLNGTIFIHKCPKCGFEIFVDQPMLCCDLEHALFIVYSIPDEDETPEESRLEWIKTMDELKEDLFGDSDTSDVQRLRFRFVKDARRFREKVVISNAGFDDRYIEIMKYLMLATVRITQEGMNPTEAFFVTGPEGASIGMLQGDQILGGFAFNPALYESVKADYSDYIDPNVDEEYEIDAAWAKEFIERLRTAKAESEDEGK